MENSIQISWVQLSQVFVKMQPHMQNINSRKYIDLAALESLPFTCTSEQPLFLLIELFFS